MSFVTHDQPLLSSCSQRDWLRACSCLCWCINLTFFSSLLLLTLVPFLYVPSSASSAACFLVTCSSPFLLMSLPPRCHVNTNSLYICLKEFRHHKTWRSLSNHCTPTKNNNQIHGQSNLTIKTKQWQKHTFRYLGTHYRIWHAKQDFNSAYHSTLKCIIRVSYDTQHCMFYYKLAWSSLVAQLPLLFIHL